MPEAETIEHRELITSTVLGILKSSDLETATELSVRTATASRLALSRFDLDQKRLIREVIESFLLSTAVIPPTQTTQDTPTINNEVGLPEEPAGPADFVLGLTAVTQDDNQSGPDYFQHNNDVNSRIICELSLTRNVTVHDVRGQSMVTIQDYHQKDGKQFPKSGGMSLTAEQWLSFKNNLPAIEDAIAKMQSRLRLPTAGEPSDPDMSHLMVDSAQANATAESKTIEASICKSNSVADPQESNFRGRIQPEVNSNGSTHNPLIHTPPNSVHVPLDNHNCQPSDSASKENLHHNSSLALPPPGLVHMPVRLDGTNYYLWKHQMEFSLAELKVAYVLTEPCPNISTTFPGTHEEMDQAKASIQKWVEDDYICRNKILTCLCDNLLKDYSTRACNAKVLWEELKSVYDEDIGTKRSEVNKYVQFQIVDGVPILEQVHELQRIAHSICSSGTWIDEDFHVSFIISKLPHSWKEFRLKMLQEEFLPLHMLMHRLKVEEDARNAKQPEKLSRADVGSKCESRVGLQSTEIKKICYNCKKKGHFSKNCPDRKMEVFDNGNPKENGHFWKNCPDRKMEVRDNRNPKENGHRLKGNWSFHG